MSVPNRVRQAVVIVHGMGEQRPLDMLSRFIDAALPHSSANKGIPRYYSRPETVSGSFEQRRFLAPETEEHAQSEFFEYHWAHLMQGNRLSDLWKTLTRVLLTPPIPKGLVGIWLIILGLVVISVFWLASHPIAITDKTTLVSIVQAIVGAPSVALVLTWLITKVLPRTISASFVDVVRYLDTSPRCYEVREKIRKGMIELLKNLHDTGRYQRIVVVAHSLGAYIAYDGITYFWAQTASRHCAEDLGDLDRAALSDLENAAKVVATTGSADATTKFRTAQRALWKALRRQGNPWLITDFVTVGTPMYMADKLLTKNFAQFQARVDLQHIATCPPQQDLLGTTQGQTYYSHPYDGGTVLYHAAPFAVVRWTNMWFPAVAGFFGDWFGGPLRPLFGKGILDVALNGNRPGRFAPAIAHARYFSNDVSAGSATLALRDALDLNSTKWLKDLLKIPRCAKRMRGRAIDTMRQEHANDLRSATEREELDGLYAFVEEVDDVHPAATERDKDWPPPLWNLVRERSRREFTNPSILIWFGCVVVRDFLSMPIVEEPYWRRVILRALPKESTPVVLALVSSKGTPMEQSLLDGLAPSSWYFLELSDTPDGVPVVVLPDFDVDEAEGAARTRYLKSFRRVDESEQRRLSWIFTVEHLPELLV